MNKKVVIILFLTLLALIGLAIYSFGANNRLSPKPNPVSLNPVNTEKVTVRNQNITFTSYSNKDIAQNYYTVKLPQDWKVQAGKDAGSYEMTFNGGSGTIQLTDVADNTTLELMILSQEEPNLKKSVSDYKRIDYQKLTINGNEAYQLTYQGKTGQTDSQTIQTYITGPDKAGIITLTVPQSSFSTYQSMFSSIIQNFQWDSK